MSNILILPQIAAEYKIARNADWLDSITFNIPPSDQSQSLGPIIDISGIDFYAQLRLTETDPNVLLDLSTVNGKLQNLGATGTLRWHIRRSELLAIRGFDTLPSGVMDILAVADGNVINLMQEAGPATVSVHRGVTLYTG